MAALSPRYGEAADVTGLDRQLMNLSFQRRTLPGGAIVWERKVVSQQNEELPLTITYDPDGRDIEPSPVKPGQYFVIAWSGTVFNPHDRTDRPSDRAEHDRILHSELVSRLFYIGSIDHAYRVQAPAGSAGPDV